MVEDDPQPLRHVRDALSKAGYAPTVTGDPEEMPRLMEKEKPHLVLLDRAFDMGAADYMVKPFSPTELAARITAAVCRRETAARAELPEPYLLGDLTIDYAERRVTVAGRPVQLTATEYDVLLELSVNAGRGLTHDHLLQRVWGPENSGESGLVRTVVKRLRRKLGDDANSPIYIFTEPRVGYRMAKAEKPGREPPVPT